MSDKLTTPVLFVIFNRPDVTQQVFNEIRKAKPASLFIAADGPRMDRKGEAEKCQAARDIVNQVDWDCEVKTLFRDKNVGCKIGVSSAIDWFFENVEEGIILEDDCLPSQSFFWFCQELLEYYRDDTRIMHINGSNFQSSIQRGSANYYFSMYVLVWGWATWRRAWKHFDISMGTFEQFKSENQIVNIFRTGKERKFHMQMFQNHYDGNVDAWGYKWVYSIIQDGGITINPNVNLVQNIGYGPDATHTLKKDKVKIIVDFVRDIEFPLKHPKFILPNEEAGLFFFRTMQDRSILTRLKNKTRRTFRSMISVCRGLRKANNA